MTVEAVTNPNSPKTKGVTKVYRYGPDPDDNLFTRRELGGEIGDKVIVRVAPDAGGLGPQPVEVWVHPPRPVTRDEIFMLIARHYGTSASKMYAQTDAVIARMREKL